MKTAGQKKEANKVKKKEQIIKLDAGGQGTGSKGIITE
jgi:hypothetical protein